MLHARFVVARKKAWRKSANSLKDDSAGGHAKRSNSAGLDGCCGDEKKEEPARKKALTDNPL